MYKCPIKLSVQITVFEIKFAGKCLQFLFVSLVHSVLFLAGILSCDPDKRDLVAS